MPAGYTIVNLTELKDSAPEFGLEEVQEPRFAKDTLDAEQAGLSYHHLRAGKRRSFGHKHDEAEEIYVVIGGSARIRLDDEILDLARLDAVRVAPAVMRRSRPPRHLDCPDGPGKREKERR